MDFRERQGINEMHRRIDNLVELVAEHDRALSEMRDNRDNSEAK